MCREKVDAGYRAEHIARRQANKKNKDRRKKEKQK